MSTPAVGIALVVWGTVVVTAASATVLWTVLPFSEHGAHEEDGGDTREQTVLATFFQQELRA